MIVVWYDRRWGHGVLKIPKIYIAPLICVAVSKVVVLPQYYIAVLAEDWATWYTTVVIENISFYSCINWAGSRPESQGPALPGCDSIFESGCINNNCILFRFSIQVNDWASLHNLIIHCSSFSIIVLEVNAWKAGSSDCQSEQSVIIGVKETASTIGCGALHSKNIGCCNTIQRECT